MSSAALIKAILVTSELCGRTFGEAAAAVFVSDLAAYPEAQVMAALVRCRKEVRGMLTMADVVNRLDDGRPSPDEAWAMLPYSEQTSAVWTDEMSQAFGVVLRLIDEGAMAHARMSFIEVYRGLVGKARDQGRPVRWSVTLGHDVDGRERVLMDAADKGRLTYAQAAEFVPVLPSKRLAPMIEAQRAAAVLTMK